MIVGKYKQGEIITHPDAQVDETGAPHRAAPAGPVPRGQQHQQEQNKTVGKNSKLPR